MARPGCTQSLLFDPYGTIVTTDDVTTGNGQPCRVDNGLLRDFAAHGPSIGHRNASQIRWTAMEQQFFCFISEGHHAVRVDPQTRTKLRVTPFGIERSLGFADGRHPSGDIHKMIRIMPCNRHGDAGIGMTHHRNGSVSPTLRYVLPQHCHIVSQRRERQLHRIAVDIALRQALDHGKPCPSRKKRAVYEQHRRRGHGGNPSLSDSCCCWCGPLQANASTPHGRPCVDLH
jgi:hypothetical protein